MTTLKEVKPLGKTCAACGRMRKSMKSLRYDPNTLLPYCETAYVCNENHPNSPQGIIDRQGELNLVTYDEALDIYRKSLEGEYGSERVRRIKHLLTTPHTVRILDPDMAEFLAEMRDRYHIETVSETIRQCILMLMDRMQKVDEQTSEAKEIVKETKAIENTIKDVESGDVFGTF